MTVPLALLPTSLAVASACAGLLVGLGYFAAVRRTIDLLTAKGNGAKALALTLGRFVTIALLLALTAKLGATELLAAFIGFLLARAMASRAAQRT